MTTRTDPRGPARALLSSPAFRPDSSGFVRLVALSAFKPSGLVRLVRSCPPLKEQHESRCALVRRVLRAGVRRRTRPRVLEHPAERLRPLVRQHDVRSAVLLHERIRIAIQEGLVAVALIEMALTPASTNRPVRAGLA